MTEWKEYPLAEDGTCPECERPKREHVSLVREDGPTIEIEYPHPVERTHRLEMVGLYREFKPTYAEITAAMSKMLLTVVETTRDTLAAGAEWVSGPWVYYVAPCSDPCVDRGHSHTRERACSSQAALGLKFSVRYPL